jgi:penicillin amidase
LDWYKIDWTDAGKTSYQYDGSLKQAELIVEKIKVKGVKEPILDTVKWTVWGPIVYENSDNPREGLAMRWQAHDGPQFIDIATFIGLIKSKNYDDYLEALQHYDYPAQNFVFASKSGDIAITVNGLFPIKNKSQGKFVQDGSLSSNSWQGWIPREQVPLVRNPSRGFVASANQHSTDPSYPYYYNSASFDHFRGRYLANRLTELDSIVPADMMALQNDNFSLHASEGLAALLKQVNRTSLNKSQLFQLDNLGQWDYRFEADKTEPILYLNWWEKYYKAVFDEVLIWSDSMAILMPENWRLMELTAESPTDKIFDVLATPQKETAREVATSSFTEAYDEINEQLKLPGFNWASKKKTSIMHLARIPSFSKENLFVGGYKNALNAIDDTHGPSWRMVVELGDEIKAWGVYPGGQSGNPGSTFYDTGVDKWVKGEYYELFFMKTPDDNRKAIRKTLTFN